MRYQCWIRGCRYSASFYYGGDLPLCVLHNSPKVIALLEAGKEPLAAWMNGIPVVLPAGALAYREPVETSMPVDVSSDPMVRVVPNDSTVLVAKDFDLR